jgi:hypothetical protein
MNKELYEKAYELSNEIEDIENVIDRLDNPKFFSRLEFCGYYLNEEDITLFKEIFSKKLIDKKREFEDL